MRILICTQAVDEDDPVLGFFHRWVEEFAKRFDVITVVCLRAGKHNLPKNVHVIPLREGETTPGFVTAARFLKFAWILRHEYKAVFIHMNQEYILLAGLMWKFLGKKIYLWRNHYQGNVLTDIAAAMCKKVFCTSASSYTAKYRKTVLMPVGIDTALFQPDSTVTRASRSILFLSRIAPSKRVEVLIDALANLAKRGADFRASIVGDSLLQDRPYHDGLKQRVKELNLGEAVAFLPGVANRETPRIYSANELFVNTSRSGMYDKTIFEAAACGCLVVASSDDFAKLAGERFSFGGETASLSRKIEQLMNLPSGERAAATAKLRNLVVENHSLHALAKRLSDELV